MGLLAWYPLNGDTKDYSGNGNDAANYGATIDDGGKIGKCYRFADNTYIQSKSMNLTGNLSFTAWIYPTGVSVDGIGGIVSNHNHNAPSNFTMNYRSAGYILVTAGYTDGTRVESIQSPSTVKLNSWLHVTFTYDIYANVGKIYFDGIEVVSKKLTKAVNFTAYPILIGQWASSYLKNYEFIGKINDVRIYDHALSTKEIKEIAKAKILHYTFDDFQEPTVNLLSQYGDPQTQRAFGIIDGNGTLSYGAGQYIDDFYCERIIKAEGAPATHASYRKCIPSVIGKKYAVSWKVKLISGNISSVGLHFNGSNAEVTHGGFDGEWYYFKTVGTASSATLCAGAAFLGSAGVDCLISSPQIEEKDHATPFTPSSRSGKIKDISGYNNDAALSLTTTPQWVNDSKIGGGAYKFSALNTIEGIPTSGLNNEEGTVSMWIKPNFSGAASFPSHIYFFRSGGKVFQIWSSNGYLYWLEGWTYNAKARQIVAGQWYHIVATWKYPIDNTTQLGAEVYIDAVPYGTIQSATPANYGATGTIGGNFDGIIDDVRIYATALSQQDIEELYKIRASIDDGGNLYAAQILENTEPTENLTQSTLGYHAPYHTVAQNGNDFNITMIGINKYIVLSLPAIGSLSGRTFSYNGFMRKNGVPYIPSNTIFNTYNKLSDISNYRSNAATGYFEGTMYFSHATTPWLVHWPVVHSDRDVITIIDFQIEEKDHPTPFTHKIRLQSTDIPNGHIYKNTVESNGCLGYEDISEIGITNGLIAYYPFDKDSKDYSGYGNHGTLSGTVTTVGGVDGNAKLFKAAGDKMAINSISGDVLTLCAWHKWDTASTNWRTLFGNTGNYHHLIFNNDRSLNVWDGAQRKFNYSVPDNNWHHYVVVINSGVNASLYVDGVFNSTITIALNLKTYPVQFIGNYGGNSYPCGTLDEVRIYDRPLAAEEVAILYDTTRPDKPSVKLTKDMLYLSGELKEGL